MTDLRDQLQATLGSAYTVESELGGGGMSRVFLAEETRFRRRVVIKVLAPELAAGVSAERFEREIALAAALQEPHIVAVIAAGDVSGLPWYSMPYVDGESLRARLDRGPLTVVETAAILRDIAKALAYAHARGIVHRDIKPENVLLSSGTAVVTDFGIAKALSASATRAAAGSGATLTRVGTSLGTPAYMAPEQAAGEDVDARADVYAWGVIAYELLAGRHPFAHRTTAQQLLAAHIAEVPLALETARVPRALAALVDRTLAKSPGQRPASGEDLLVALDAVDVMAVHATSKRWPVLAGAAALIVLAGAGALLVRGRSAPATNTLAPARVLVLPFENRTGDSALAPLGGMVADWITRGLTETGLVEVAPLPIGMTPAGGEAVTAARAARAGTLLAGTIYRVGDSVRVVATITDVNAGTVTTSLDPESAPAANPTSALEHLRRRVAGALARRIDPTFDPDRLLGAPPSFQTYRAMLDAGELVSAGNLEAAAEAYRKIGAMDTTYALPLLEETSVRRNLRQSVRVDTLFAELERRRGQLTPYEQARVDLARATHERGTGGSLPEARRLAGLAPRSATALHALAWQLLATNRMEEAHETLRQIDTSRLANKQEYWFEVAFASHALGEFARELGEVDAGLRSYPTSDVLLGSRVRALAGLGRMDEVAATLATADRVGLATATSVYATAAAELLAHRHAAAAADAEEALVQRARAFRSTDDRRGTSPFALRWLAPAAALGLLGREREALVLTDSADAELWADPGQRLVAGMSTDLPLWAVGLRGVIAAHDGDTPRAVAADRMLDTLRPAPGIARATALVGRASIAAQLGRRDEAVARLREAIAAGATFGGTVTWSILRPASGIRPEAPWFAPLRGYAPFEELVRPVR